MKNEDYYVTPQTWGSPSASASVSLLWGVCKESTGLGAGAKVSLEPRCPGLSAGSCTLGPRGQVCEGCGELVVVGRVTQA